MSKHIPARSCCICRVRFPKRELIRYVKQQCSDGNSQYVRDSEQILPGRGIYLCNDNACIERGHKKLSMQLKIKE